MFSRPTLDPGNSRQDCLVVLSDDDVKAGERVPLSHTVVSSDDECCLPSVQHRDDEEDGEDDERVKERRQSVQSVGDACDDDSPPVSHLRRKKHSFARMVDLKIDLDIESTYRSGPGKSTYRSGPDKSKDQNIPDIQVEEAPQRGDRDRSVSFNLLRCRSGSESSHYFTPTLSKKGNKNASDKDLRQMNKHTFDKDLRPVKKHSSDKDLRQTKHASTGSSLLSTPTTYDYTRRASDTTIKYKDELRRIGFSPATTRKEVMISNNKSNNKKLRQRVSSEKSNSSSNEVLESTEETDGEPSPMPSFPSSPATVIRKQQRISLPFIRLSEPEPLSDGGADIQVGKSGKRSKGRTRRQTYAHMTNMRMKAGANAANSESSELTPSYQSGEDDINPLRNSTGTLDMIGEQSIQEFNLDYDLDAMRKKSCFVLTSRVQGEEAGSSTDQPENLMECTNLVKAIEFAAFEINEAHQKKHRRSSCPTKMGDELHDDAEQGGKSPKRWRKKSSIISKISHTHTKDCEHTGDMKKILDDFKDSEIIISNIDRLVGRRGGVSEKCNIERQLVKHAVKHLMKNAILAQAI